MTNNENILHPKIGVGAVVWEGESVLLIKRGNPPLKGGWSLPGGKQKLGETLEEAIVREVIEETGITPEIGGLIDVVDYIERDENGKIKFHYSLIDYWGEALGGVLEAASDVTEARFVHYKKLDEYDLWIETRSIIEKSAKLRGRPRSHTLKGHLKTLGIATVFGLSAYGLLKLLKLGLNSIGLGI